MFVTVSVFEIKTRLVLNLNFKTNLNLALAFEFTQGKKSIFSLREFYNSVGFLLFFFLIFLLRDRELRIQMYQFRAEEGKIRKLEFARQGSGRVLL